MPHLFIESDMAKGEQFVVPGGKVSALVRRCPDKSEPNDDSAAVIPTLGGGVVLVVADGVGGCPMGYRASSIAVQSIAQRVSDMTEPSDLRPVILDGIENANRQILELGIGAATTLSIVEITRGVFRAYQVGDSMTLVVGQRGALKWRSTNHSPVGYAIESGMLDESDAMSHVERHLVSNLVGSRDMHIEIGPARNLSARDTVIVGSDGLFDNLLIEEIVDRARCGDPMKRLNRLDVLATERMTQSSGTIEGKPDDLSILIFTV